MLSHFFALLLVSGALAAVPTSPAGAADPESRALARLDDDSDRPVTMRGAGSGGHAGFIGVPAGGELDNPDVHPGTGVAEAADLHVARYGAAVGAERSGTTWNQTSARPTAVGDVVRYQQEVAGVPVVGGQVVVSLRSDRELSSMLAETSEVTRVADATVGESEAEAEARAAFLKGSGAGGGTTVESLGRWVLDAGLIGGDPAVDARGVWRFEVTRDADERRQIMIDDRTGAVLMDVDEIQHAVDRVVCDDNNVRRSSDVPCTSGFARTEGAPANGQADVDTAYDLSGVVADFYQQVAGVDLTQLLGITVSGQKKLASTVRWCYTGSSNACPYDNAFWNGSQMYYGQGYAVADDVVGHEITHGFTERNSGLFYWGQSGAMNESISDIIGEIIDHRHPSAGDSPTNWAMGEDIPGFPDGLRNMADPTVFNDPDTTSSTFYRKEASTYPDNDGVHTNSGVGNKTAFLISQGGTFNGQTMTGIDTGDPTLTKSARLWVLVDQSLTSGSDYADEAAVLDQSCQALLAGGTAGFTADDCTNVHKATLATQLRDTPTNNPQPADAAADCPAGTTKRVLMDSETGAPASTFVAGPTWAREATLSHSAPDAWVSSDPAAVGTSALVASTSVPLPAGQSSYLYFQQWRVLDYDTGGFYDGGTVEVDAGAGPVDTASLPWINGPSQTIHSGFSNPAAGRLGFGGDSRGYLASRVDLSSFAGSSVKPRFTMNTDSSISFPGWAVDDISLYTCDVPALASSVAPTVSGSPRVGSTLTAAPGSWTPTPDSFAFQWLRAGTPIGGATTASYAPVATDVGQTLSVRVTAVKAGFTSGTATSGPTAAVGLGTLVRGTPTVAGKAQVGARLTVKPGTWRPAGVTLRLQWLRNGKPINKATRSTYAVTRADQGKRISVRVTGSRAGYATATATSKATGKVKAKKRR
ncbi:hypothetical protein ASC77_22635 [Nocardioides sp. Root1257]|nr:hypothetical protein ASC77_22635 [Nocardioides sp. Root1257]KRC41954.1 hypothetical protein ASE24_22425 [Nocardioides sp. Root224]